MSEQITQIDEKIKELKQEKKQVKSKIMDDKIKKKKERKNNGNGANVVIRVSHNFDEAILNIQNKRIEIGRDNNPISGPKLTALIVRHKLWQQIRNDLIDFYIGGKNEEHLE